MQIHTVVIHGAVAQWSAHCQTCGDRVHSVMQSRVESWKAEHEQLDLEQAVVEPFRVELRTNKSKWEADFQTVLQHLLDLQHVLRPVINLEVSFLRGGVQITDPTTDESSTVEVDMSYWTEERNFEW